jgi:hypothetical protein
MKRPSDDQLQRLGKSLREIDPSNLQQEPDAGRVRWFLGEGGTELFAWMHEDAASPHHVQLVFAEVSVEWVQGRGLVTGRFHANAAIAGGRYDPYLMAEGVSVDPDVCRAAITLLRASPIEHRLLQPLNRAMELALSQSAGRSPPT